MPASSSVSRLGTRGSLLARTQSQLVADELSRLHPGLHVELVTVRTSGDRVTDRPLHEVGGKGLFTKELEQALLAGAIDLAVHSYKDVPVTMPLVDPAGLVIVTPKREDPRDVLVSTGAGTVENLQHGARVGTSSLRRRCQLLARRPDLKIEPLRGNIDTRLRKLREGQYDAVVLAAAGLRRVGLFDASVMTFMEPEVMLPAAGQGALALQCRSDDLRTRGLLSPLNDAGTSMCVAAERAVVKGLNGDCHSPIAALATLERESMFRLDVAVGTRDGNPPVVRATARASADSTGAAVAHVLEQLASAGVLPPPVRPNPPRAD